jgi:hypothetical protein
MRRPGAGCSTLAAALFALVLVIVMWLMRYGATFAPNTLPWRPVVLDAPPRWLAHWQMYRLGHDGPRCLAVLEGAGHLGFTRLRDRRIDDRCGFTNVVRADSQPVAFSPHVTATCALTAALYWFQVELAPIARQEMHSDLVRIDQLGTFSCRNVNSEVDGRRSQHATANAIDVAAFHFANGKTASVLRDFGKPSPAGRFLDRAHGAACKVFGTVLGPRYNRLHANHFHLDVGGAGFCP